jgi:hypothetical protein
MVFKLIESAQRRWRMVNAPHLVALVRAGSAFVNGKLVERTEDQTGRNAVSRDRGVNKIDPQVLTIALMNGPTTNGPGTNRKQGTPSCRCHGACRLATLPRSFAFAATSRSNGQARSDEQNRHDMAAERCAVPNCLTGRNTSCR